MIIAVDFDGTIVDHRFPEIGSPVPGAFKWLKAFKEAGATLILWTMRSDGQESGPVLTDAVEFCACVEFDGINENPAQKSWTQSPKAYAHVYIDDAAFGCPLKENPRCGGRPFVDWDIVGPAIMAQIEQEKLRQAQDREEAVSYLDTDKCVACGKPIERVYHNGFSRYRHHHCRPTTEAARRAANTVGHEGRKERVKSFGERLETGFQILKLGE